MERIKFKKLVYLCLITIMVSQASNVFAFSFFKRFTNKFTNKLRYKKSKSVVGIAAISHAVSKVYGVIKNTIVRQKVKKCPLLPALGAGIAATLGFSWLIYALFKKIKKNNIEKQKEYKKIIPIVLEDLQKRDEKFKHEGRESSGYVFYDQISSKCLLIKGKIERSKLFDVCDLYEFYRDENFSASKLEYLFDDEKSKELLENKKSCNILGFEYEFKEPKKDVEDEYIKQENRLVELRKEVVKGKARLFKIHLQIKPEYLASFAKDFDKLTKENDRFKNIICFKVLYEINKKYYIQNHKVGAKDEHLAYPTVVIYVCLVRPEDKHEAIKTIVQGVWDRYRLVSKEISLPIVPRFNRRIKDFIYIAGGNGDTKKHFYFKLKFNKEKSKIQEIIDRIYTKDYAFFKGHEVDVNKLSKEIVKDHDLKKNLFAKIDYKEKEDHSRIYDVLVYTSS